MLLGSLISAATLLLTVTLWRRAARPPVAREPAAGSDAPDPGAHTVPAQPSGCDKGDRTLQRQLHFSSELMAGLAHELRGPLQGMLGIAEMLAPTEADQERRRLLHTVRRTTVHMLHVLDDSVELARMEQRPEPMALRPFRLESVLADVFANARPIRAEGVELCIDLAETVILSYQGEPDRLRQILTNLVSNSLVRTHSGYVLLCVHAAPDELHLSVQDTGPGIPDRRHRELFDPFSRGDAAPGHAGLGLAIARRLAATSGGRLEVGSRTGEGTRFVLHMPFPPLDEPFPRPRDAPRRRIGIADHSLQHRHVLTGYCERWGLGVDTFDTLVEIEDAITHASKPDALVVAREWLRTTEMERVFRQRCREMAIPLILLGDPEDPDFPETGLLPGSIWPRPLLPGELATALDMIDANPDPIDPTRRPVLIVDDNPLVRTVLADVVADLGCMPTLAHNGLAAVRAAAIASPIALVLLDRNMPGMDGLHAARVLRRQPATRDATLILLVNDQTEAERADIGAVDHILIRPRGRDALRRTLAPLLNSSEMPRGGADEPLPPAPERLLEESLLEDLDRLELAMESGAIEAVRDQIHRMRGAMRMFRATRHELWLDGLQQALGDWRKGPAPIALTESLVAARRALSAPHSDRV